MNDPIINDNHAVSGDNYSVRLVTATPKAEIIMAYIARVSSPNQENPSFENLLSYCLRKCHWSVFEHAFMTVEIVTSRMISQQIIRHKSFSFSEFSQRYAPATNMVKYKPRRQDDKNRQSSIDDLPDEIIRGFEHRLAEIQRGSMKVYEYFVGLGVAKECARAMLPLSTETKLYMTGSCRSWIHYIQVRTDLSVQKEHREIAAAIDTIFSVVFPTVHKAMATMKEGAQ